jgi:carbon monoxide dehydrogenase subunit G
MTKTSVVRSITIDAPAAVVFQYVEDPQHTYGRFPGVEITDTDLKDEGIGSSFTFAVGMLGMKFHATVTREDQVVDERIVDRSSTGPVWTLELHPEHDKTDLRWHFDYATRAPGLDKAMMMTVGRHTEEGMDDVLEAIKADLEG